MNVRELIAKLSTLDPEALIVKTGPDNEYFRVSFVRERQAEENHRGTYLGEFFPEHQCLSRGAKLIPVVVLE